MSYDGSGHFGFPSLPGPARLSGQGLPRPDSATTISRISPLTVRPHRPRSDFHPRGRPEDHTESVVVTAAPQVDVVADSSTATLDDKIISTTPVLGRKFEDLVTLTPGVSIIEAPTEMRSSINRPARRLQSTSPSTAATSPTASSASRSGEFKRRRWSMLTLDCRQGVPGRCLEQTNAGVRTVRCAAASSTSSPKSGTNDTHGGYRHYRSVPRPSPPTPPMACPSPTSIANSSVAASADTSSKTSSFTSGASEGVDENLLRANLSACLPPPQLSSIACLPSRNPDLPLHASPTRADQTPTVTASAKVLINFYKANYNLKTRPARRSRRPATAPSLRVDYSHQSQEPVLRCSYNHSTTPAIPTRPSTSPPTAPPPTVSKAPRTSRPSTSISSPPSATAS